MLVCTLIDLTMCSSRKYPYPPQKGFSLTRNLNAKEMCLRVFHNSLGPCVFFNVLAFVIHSQNFFSETLFKQNKRQVDHALVKMRNKVFKIRNYVNTDIIFCLDHNTLKSIEIPLLRWSFRHPVALFSNHLRSVVVLSCLVFKDLQQDSTIRFNHRVLILRRFVCFIECMKMTFESTQSCRIM